MGKKEPYKMSEERRQEMIRYHQMSDEELAPIRKNWTDQDWVDFINTMNEERRQEMLRYRQLPKEEFIPICKKWTKQDWIDYYTCVGVMTLDEFCRRLLEITIKTIHP